MNTYDGTYGTEHGTGELDLITLIASTPHTELLVSKVEVRVKVTPVNDAPVLYVQYGIYSDGSTVSSSSSPSSSSYFYSYSSDSMSATATAGSGSGSGSTSVTTTDQTRVLTEDMLSPMILSTLILYTKENIPLLINGTTVRDIDCTNSTFLKITLTAINGNISISLPQNDPFNPTNATGLYFESGTGVSDSHMIFTGPISAVNNVLSVLIFTPKYQYFGLDCRLIITADDLNNVGVGGAKTDTQVSLLYVLVAVRACYLYGV